MPSLDIINVRSQSEGEDTAVGGAAATYKPGFRISKPVQRKRYGRYFPVRIIWPVLVAHYAYAEVCLGDFS